MIHTIFFEYTTVWSSIAYIEKSYIYLKAWIILRCVMLIVLRIFFWVSSAKAPLRIDGFSHPKKHIRELLFIYISNRKLFSWLYKNFLPDGFFFCKNAEFVSTDLQSPPNEETNIIQRVSVGHVGKPVPSLSFYDSWSFSVTGHLTDNAGYPLASTSTKTLLSIQIFTYTFCAFIIIVLLLLATIKVSSSSCSRVIRMMSLP